MTLERMSKFMTDDYFTWHSIRAKTSPTNVQQWQFGDFVTEYIFYTPKVSGTKNGGTEPYTFYKTIFGVEFPLHKPNIHTAENRFGFLHFRYETRNVNGD